MFSEILNVLGLVVSAGGAIGSVQTSTEVKNLESRISAAEELLKGVTDDMSFIRAALDTLVAFDSASTNSYPVLRVRYASTEYRVRNFLQHPEKYGGQPHLDLRSAITKAKPLSCIPVLLKTPEDEIKTFSIPFRRLQEEDIFGATPLATFDPATVSRIATFLSDLEQAKEAGDRFEFQFEVED